MRQEASQAPESRIGVNVLRRGVSTALPVYLAVYLVCICFQARNTQIHAYPNPSPSVSTI